MTVACIFGGLWLQTSSSVSITFTRLLDTFDPLDQVITDTPLYLLYAYSPRKGNSSTSPVTYPIHTVYGSTLVNFMGSDTLPRTGLVPLDPGQLVVCAMVAVVGCIALARAVQSACAAVRCCRGRSPNGPLDSEALPLVPHRRTDHSDSYTGVGGPTKSVAPSAKTLADHTDAVPEPSIPTGSTSLAGWAFGARLKHTDHAVGDVLVGVIFACLNVAAFYIGSAPSAAHKLGPFRIAARRACAVGAPETRVQADRTARCILGFR